MGKLFQLLSPFGRQIDEFLFLRIDNDGFGVLSHQRVDVDRVGFQRLVGRPHAQVVHGLGDAVDVAPHELAERG